MTITVDLARHEAGHALAAAVTEPSVTEIKICDCTNNDGSTWTLSRTTEGGYLQSFQYTLGGIASSAALDSRAAVLPLWYRLSHPLAVIGLRGVGQTCRFDVEKTSARCTEIGVHIHHPAVARLLRPLALLSLWHVEPLAQRVFARYPIVLDADELRASALPSWQLIEAQPADLWDDRDALMRFAQDSRPVALAAE